MELQSQILGGAQIEDWLRKAINEGAENLLLCSAYIRSDALNSLFADRDTASGSVLVRWRLEDLVCGASDLAVFDECQRLGLSLFMRLDFHGKAYAVPNLGVAIGSANLTLSGLGLHDRSNAELCTLIEYNGKNVEVLNQMFKGAKKVDKDLVEQLAAFLPEINQQQVAQWPEQIRQLVNVDDTRDHLFVDECFWSDRLPVAGGADEVFDLNQMHDIELLGLTAPVERSILKLRIRQSPMFRWLVTYLSSCPEKTAYFGNLSSALHTALVCDPAPWRSTVKQLLQNLLTLVQDLEIEDISIDRPRHSQRVRLSVEAISGDCE